MHPAARPTDSGLVRARTSLGDFELTICSDGTYLLDGGAMFGVVPKTLWQRRMAADDENRILLGLNTVVVRTGKHTVVIETGIGNKQSPKMRAIHENQEQLPASLASAGVRPEEVDVVINTNGLSLEVVGGRLVDGVIGQIKRIPDISPTLIQFQTLSVAASVLIIVFPIMFWWTAAFRPETRSAESVQLLNDLASMCFIIGFTPYVAWAVAVGMAVLSDHTPEPRFPRWSGYLSIFVGLAQMPVKTGVMCPMYMAAKNFPAKLATPVGNRAVIDLATGAPAGS